MQQYTFLITTSIVLVLVALLFAVGGQPRSVSSRLMPVFLNSEINKSLTASKDAPDTRRDVLIEARDAPRAPALAEGTWINSEPLALAALRGRVVLVDFWTFGCYNCRNTLPALKRWDARYRERGLTIIGVHSPEFDREKNIDNVRREVHSLGIRYAVVTDNDYETWRAYGIEAWPTVVILDKQGRIRWLHVGEGLYDEQESVINKLLAE